jgi:transcriptional regulator with XRE-family HTH domain
MSVKPTKQTPVERQQFPHIVRLPMSTPKREFAENLKRFMKLKGKDVPELMQATGSDQRTIERWLAAKTMPRAKTLLKLASALDISPEELSPDLQYRPDALERIEGKLNLLLERAGLPTDSLPSPGPNGDGGHRPTDLIPPEDKPSPGDAADTG